MAENVPGEVIVKFKPQVMEIPRGLKAAGVAAVTVRKATIRDLNTKHGVIRVKQLFKDVLEIRPDWTHLENQYVIIFPEDKDPDGIAREYSEDENVVSASPNTMFRAFETNPDDPYFSGGQQFGLTNISAPSAWDRTTGTNEVTIAVMDTGVNHLHEDLVGKVDLATSKDYVNDDDDPLDDHSSRHGTSVAGVIAADSNNGVGIAGVDWNARIMGIKVLDSSGNGTMANILQGLAWASANGADVVNMSFGQYSASSSLQSACQDAYDNGLVLAAAAGNGNVDDPSYPAYYSTVLSVAAVDSSDERSIWTGIDPATGKTKASNYGTWVDVSAPGTNIYSVYYQPFSNSC